MINDDELEINPSTYANQRVKFIGSDARLTVIYIIIFLLYKSWIVVGMFAITMVISILMEMNDIDFINYLKKIRLSLSGTKDRKYIKNKY